MSKGKGGKGHGGDKGEDEVVDPLKIEGSCAYCPCGHRVEMPGDILLAEHERFLRCPGCVRLIHVPPRGFR